MLLRATTLLLLVAAGGCASTSTGTATTPALAAAPAAAPATKQAYACAVRVGAPGEAQFPYAYAAFSNEMQRLRQPGHGAFNVRRALDRVADAVESLPDPEGVGTQAAAGRVREEVTRLIDASPGQGQRAQATRRALVETHGVLRRLAEGPCRGDPALLHRVDQLDDAIASIPDDPAESHVSLAPIVIALERTQSAFLALSTSHKRLPRAEAGPVTLAQRTNGRVIE